MSPRWKAWTLALALTAAAIGPAFAREKKVTLPEMIRDLKTQEQEDGNFRAKISAQGEIRALLLTGGCNRPENIRTLAGLTTLRSLSTNCLPQDALQELTGILSSLTGLQKLYVASPVAKAWDLDFFKALSSLREMRQLRLGYATLPTGGLKLIADLPNLAVLELPSVRQLNPQDLEELQRCPHLVELSARGARLDDTAVKFILGIKSLKFLDIEDTRLSQESKAALQARGITLRSFANHEDMPGTPWRPWME